MAKPRSASIEAERRRICGCISRGNRTAFIGASSQISKARTRRRRDILANVRYSRFSVLLLWVCAAAHSLLAQAAAADVDAREAQRLAAQVKQEFLHAYRNYERYAWGHDELQPLSRTPRDWYGQSLLMTPVDALDTLILMDLRDEADRT